jgi:hypothetical protein
MYPPKRCSTLAVSPKQFNICPRIMVYSLVLKITIIVIILHLRFLCISQFIDLLLNPANQSLLFRCGFSVACVRCSMLLCY